MTVRAAILDIIVSLQHERGFAALIVTADLGEVRRLSNRVAVMHRGVMVGYGDLETVLGDPQHPYVKSLAASAEATSRITPGHGPFVELEPVIEREDLVAP